jgi:hypothetical protein
MYERDSKVAIIGDLIFPPVNKSHVTRRRQIAYKRIFDVIKKYKPSMVYLCPTKGVNINLLPPITKTGTPYSLIIPQKHFCNGGDIEFRRVLDYSLLKAHKIILLNEHKECGPLDWFNAWCTATKKAISNADWVLVIRSEEVSPGFVDLMEELRGTEKATLEVNLDAGLD